MYNFYKKSFPQQELIKGFKLDLLVEDEVVVELKAVQLPPKLALSQTISYLKATKLKRGLIINFGEKRLIDGIKRVSVYKPMLQKNTGIKPS